MVNSETIYKPLRRR